MFRYWTWIYWRNPGRGRSVVDPVSRCFGTSRGLISGKFGRYACHHIWWFVGNILIIVRMGYWTFWWTIFRWMMQIQTIFAQEFRGIINCHNEVHYKTILYFTDINFEDMTVWLCCILLCRLKTGINNYSWDQFSYRTSLVTSFLYVPEKWLRNSWGLLSEGFYFNQILIWIPRFGSLSCTASFISWF